MSIQIFYDRIDFRVKGWRKVKKLVEKVISEVDKVSGDLNFIITDDNSLKKINIEFLQHNYFTDVISFNYSSEGKISGEVYISLDTVKINAINYNVSLDRELVRVIVHGVLHLCGYEDKYSKEKLEMKKKEEYWLFVYDSI